MCHRMFEHGESDWNSKDPRSDGEENESEKFKLFFERCPNLKLFLKEYSDSEPSRETIESELRMTLNNLNIDMKEIERLETKQINTHLTLEEQQTLTIAREDQLKMEEKITWLNKVLIEYDSFEDFKNTLES